MSEQFFRHHVVSLYGAIDVVSVDAYWEKNISYWVVKFRIQQQKNEWNGAFRNLVGTSLFVTKFMVVAFQTFSIRFSCLKINRNIFLTFETVVKNWTQFKKMKYLKLKLNTKKKVKKRAPKLMNMKRFRWCMTWKTWKISKTYLSQILDQN